MCGEWEGRCEGLQWGSAEQENVCTGAGPVTNRPVFRMRKGLLAMSQPIGPGDPGVRRELNAFLMTSGAMLLGRIDGRGVVVAANRGLGRWIEGGAEPRLESALRPRSRVRWQEVLSTPGRRQRLTLWFGSSWSERAPFRCWFVREEGEISWFFGEPRPAPLAVGTAEDRLATDALRAELARARQRAHRLAGTDVLTGLANRRKGLRRLAAAARRARQRGTPLACLMVDLDRFKAVNDTFGHPTGDRVLREAARALAQGLRGSDLVARYGGDEFLIVLPATTAADAQAIADRLRARLAGRRRVASTAEPLDASIGIAVLGPDESAQGLLARADAALIHAKHDGRGCVILDGTATPRIPAPPCPGEESRRTPAE
jgi:diguanylate cyclase (GGDEF)-like protein